MPSTAQCGALLSAGLSLPVSPVTEVRGKVCVGGEDGNRDGGWEGGGWGVGERGVCV